MSTFVLGAQIVELLDASLVASQPNALFETARIYHVFILVAQRNLSLLAFLQSVLCKHLLIQIVLLSKHRFPIGSACSKLKCVVTGGTHLRWQSPLLTHVFILLLNWGPRWRQRLSSHMLFFFFLLEAIVGHRRECCVLHATLPNLRILFIVFGRFEEIFCCVHLTHSPQHW